MKKPWIPSWFSSNQFEGHNKPPKSTMSTTTKQSVTNESGNLDYSAILKMISNAMNGDQQCKNFILKVQNTILFKGRDY